MAATFGAGALGLLCYVGLICAVWLVFMQPVVMVLCGGVWIVAVLVTRAMR